MRGLLVVGAVVAVGIVDVVKRLGLWLCWW